MADLIVRLILVAAVASALLWTAAKVVGHFEDKGRVKEAAVWAPKLEAMTTARDKALIERDGARADLAKVKSDYEAQGKAVTALRQEADARAAKVKELLAAIAKRSARWDEEVKRLQAVAVSSNPPKELICEETDRILRAVAVDRVRGKS